jgi:hypothetical protein
MSPRKPESTQRGRSSWCWRRPRPSWSAACSPPRPQSAATSAVLALALVPSPGWLSPFDAGPALLALAFVLPAAALLVGHRSRSSGCAAALLAGAGLLAQPLLTTLVFVSALIAAGRLRPAAPRATAVAGGALALAAPVLLRAVPAISGREWSGLVSAPVGSEWLRLAGGVGLLVLVPLVLARGMPVEPVGRRRRALFLLGSTAVVLLGLRFHRWMAEGQLSPAERAWLTRAGIATGQLDRVCAPVRLAAWVPALAQRAVEPPPSVPGVYRDELLAAIPKDCRNLGPPGR